MKGIHITGVIAWTLFWIGAPLAAQEATEAASSADESAAAPAASTDATTSAETTSPSPAEQTPTADSAAAPDETEAAAPTTEAAPADGTAPTDAATPAPAPAPASSVTPPPPTAAPYVDPETPKETPPAPTGPRKLMLLIGPGIGFSFMYPKEVNDYLDYFVDSQGASMEEGFSGLVLSIQPKLAIAFAPIEYVQIQVVGEIGWAPKIIAVYGGNSESFHYMRYTVGGTIAGNIPLQGGRKAISLGGGALFNVLSFEGIQEIAAGGRGVFGFRFYGRKAFTPEIFLEFNWIRASTGAPMASDPAIIGELDYVSATIGGNFYFKVTEKR